MSLRDFFSRKNETHRRRKYGLATSALATRAELLEDRVLLSVEFTQQGFTQHGVNFQNVHVLGRTDVTFFDVNNPRYSNNNTATPGRGNGNGLNVVLDGAAPDGSGNLVAQLRSVQLRGLTFNNNGNAGAVINIRNMTLDQIVIDSSVFTNNASSGLIIRLTNAQVGRIIINNCNFSNNAFEGLTIDGINGNNRVDNIRMTTNVIGNSRANDGSLLRFTNSRLGVVDVFNNQFANNGSTGNPTQINPPTWSGLHIDLNNTNTASLNLVRNSSTNNFRHGVFLDFEDSDVRGSVRGNALTSARLGDGLSILMRRSIVPGTGQAAGGLRNLDLDIFSDMDALGQTLRNSFSGNARAGINIDLGQNTTFGGAIRNNLVTNNQRVGINLQAKDALDAFDVLIGGETFDNLGNSLDANTIDGNGGAGIAIALDDTNTNAAGAGNTSGRFRILNNIIRNSVASAALGPLFSGVGILVRAQGNISLANGAARILNSRIDGNTISGNASHGMSFEISEDSELVDLIIGDVLNPNDPNEGFEGDGFNSQGQFLRNSGNQVTGNLGDGLFFRRRDAALVRDVRIIDNLFDGNANGVNYIVQNDDNVVNTVIIQHNDVTNNLVDGLVLSTQIDAQLLAIVDNNLIAGNLGDGIFTRGVENDASDVESLGGTWTRNTIQGNAGIGININTITGEVAPLTIGMLGFDGQGRSLGNLIDTNGDDGIEVNSPGDIAIVNNVITLNGQNNVAGNPHGDGKGIDINLNDFATGFVTSGPLFATIVSNIIQSNRGDGIEVLARSNDSGQSFVSAFVTAFANIIDLNLGRGVDVLNAGRADSYLIFGDGTEFQQNNIRSNGLEGFYAVNTPSITQRQDVDATTPLMADVDLGSGFQRARRPNLTLDIVNNDIRQNGDPGNLAAQLNGSGLVIRVGASGSTTGSEFEAAELPDYDGVNVSPFEFNAVGNVNSAADGNGRVNARVNNNTFGGNLGVDVLTESFLATTDPGTTAGTWNGTTYDITGASYVRDPLARFNFEFRNNTGESVDLVRPGAEYDNAEGTFKSRTSGRTAPDPNGPFGGVADRNRDAQRLVGRGGNFTFPEMGVGGLFSGMAMGSSGSVTSVTPGTVNTPIRITTDVPHLLSDFDVVLLAPFFDNGPFVGFSLANLFEVIVIDQMTFDLVNTVGESDIEEFDFFGMDFFQVTNFNAFLYPGVGPSTFRIIESGNSFPQDNDFTTGREDGELAPGTNFTNFTYDREEEGAFNFGTLVTSNATVMEGGIARFVATLTDGLPPNLQFLTISYRTEFAGSATDGADYTPVMGSVTLFPGDDPTVTIDIQTAIDGVFESDETFKLVIDSIEALLDDPGTGFSYFEEVAVPVNRFAIGTITDDDPQPTITINNSGGFEKLNGTSTMTFTVTLSNPSSFPVFVDFSTEDGTANVGADYRANEGTLTFAPGEMVKTITIEILPDAGPVNASAEPDETLFVRLTAAQGATLTNTVGTGTIFDARIVNIADAFANGDADPPGTATAQFRLTLTDAAGNPSFVPFGQQIVVNFSTQNGTATAAGVDADYVAVTNGMVTFNQFENGFDPMNPKIISVTVNQDRVFEGDERFFVNITSTEGSIIDGQANGNILEGLEVASVRTPNGQSQVRAFDSRTNTQRFAFNPYPGFAGEARIALGDFNGDGIDDIVTAAGPGGGPHVKVFNGATGQELFGFFAYATNFTGGVWVATGDINNDGTPDIITGADAGGGPHVKVFDGVTRATIESFLASGNLLSFTGGIRVASADVDGLPGDEIILGYGPGGFPIVEVYLADGNPATPISPNPFRSFLAYNPNFDGGVFVAAADFGGGPGNAQDGIADVVTGAGGTGGAHVTVRNGATLAFMENFFAYATTFRGGVRVATGDVADDPNDPLRDRIPELITAPGTSGGPHVRGFNIDANPATSPQAVVSVFAFPSNFTSGLYISGRNRNLPGEGSPLMLDPSAATTGDVPVLTQADLAPVIAAAFDRLSQAGISSSALDRLRSIEFIITDLKGLTIGLQTQNRILIDRTAAGRGYFVDLTPDLDEEFENVAGQWVATDALAKDRVDLLTVLLHEMQHALGEDHELGGHHLLAPTILPGVRRLPEHDSIFADGELFESLLLLN